MFILESWFHIKNFNLLHGIFLSITCLGIFIISLLIFMIKNIGVNYRIYGLIIIKTTKKSLMLDYGLSNTTFEPLNHAFAPRHFKGARSIAHSLGEWSSLPSNFVYITKSKGQYEKPLFKDKLHNDHEDIVVSPLMTIARV